MFIIKLFNKIKADLKWEGWSEFLKWQYRSVHVLFDKRFNNGGWDWITSFARVNDDWFACRVLGHYEYFIMCPIEWIISIFLRVTVSPFWYVCYLIDRAYFYLKCVHIPHYKRDIHIWLVRMNQKYIQPVFNWADIPEWLEKDRKREQRWQETLNKVNKRKGRIKNAERI